jgi:hypothetical protein
MEIAMARRLGPDQQQNRINTLMQHKRTPVFKKLPVIIMTMKN